MLNTLRKFWLILFVAGSFVAILVLFMQESASIVIPGIVAGEYLAAAAVIQIVFWTAASVMWSSTVRATASSKLSLWLSFLQLAFVSIGKYLPGKVWGIVARGSHMTRQGIGVRDAAIATLYEQFILFHSAAVISAVLFAAIQRSAVAISLAVIATISIYFGSALAAIAVKIGSWLAWKAGVQTKQYDFEALPKTAYLRLTLGYLVVWVLIGAVYLCLYQTFFARELDFPIVAGLILANAMAIALGFFAVFAPGAIGVREAIAAALLTNFIPLPEAAVLVIMFRLWTILMDVIAGVIVVFSSRASLSG